MQREVQHKVHGGLRTNIQYYHKIVAVVIVSTPFPVPLGIRFQKDGETEVACALALLKDLERESARPSARSPAPHYRTTHRDPAGA
jgi:hypothetical protein